MTKTKQNGTRRATEAKTLEVAQLKDAEWNTHRAAKADDAAYIGLKASLKANGMMHRVVVRPLTNQAYEIIDGHRRVEAARALGWKEVPCEVVGGLTDAEAQAMTATANIQRLENDPLLEAELIERLRGAGKTYEQIAAVLGKTARYVARRARLCNLTEKWRGWFGRMDGVGADLMETVAAHTKALQDEVFDGYISRDDEEVDEDDIYREFRRRLYLLDAETPFDQTECGRCPLNTATNGWLFPPEDEDGGIKGRCQDKACYHRHWNVAVDETIAALRKRGEKVRAARQRWDIPDSWNTTPFRTVTNTQPWVYADGELRHLVWAKPSAEAKAAKEAKTKAERDAASALRARQKAWHDRRTRARQAFDAAGEGLLRAMVMKATETQAFRDWGVAALAAPEWWSDRRMKDFVDVVGRAEVKKVLPCDGGDIDALYEEEPQDGGEDNKPTTARRSGGEETGGDNKPTTTRGSGDNKPTTTREEEE